MENMESKETYEPPKVTELAEYGLTGRIEPLANNACTPGSGTNNSCKPGP